MEVGGAALRASRLEAKSIEQKEIRSQRSEVGDHKTEDRGQTTEGGGQKEIRRQRSEVGDHKTEDGEQRERVQAGKAGKGRITLKRVLEAV